MVRPAERLERRWRSVAQLSPAPAVWAGGAQLAVVGTSTAGLARTYRLVHRPGRSAGWAAALRRRLP